MKTCTKCNLKKELSAFTVQKTGREGFKSSCKQCGNSAAAVYRATHKEQVRAAIAAWQEANRTKVRALVAAWSAAHPQQVKDRKAAWRKANLEKIKAYSASWYAMNREKMRAASSAWAKANPERSKANGVSWRAANPEKIKAANAAWRAANPEAKRMQCRNRRARKLLGGGKLSKDLSAKLFKLQRGKCPCCGKPLGDDFHLDHITPIALNGQNVDSNMQLLRATCNMKKSAKHPVDYMQSKGFLL